MVAELGKVVARKTSKESDGDGDGVGLSGGLLDEFLHHCGVAKTKSADFIGRSELLDESMQIIRKATESASCAGQWSIFLAANCTNVPPPMSTCRRA